MPELLPAAGTRPVLSAFDIARHIAAGLASARAVVAGHIERLRTANAAINAVTADRFAAAMLEAAAVDAAQRRGEALPSLAGVPFTVKEMISVAGMPHTLGTLARRDRRAERDATVVARLRAAGAIPIAVTNVPEWGFWFETDNLIYGRTKNPWNPARTAGGSSGGEAAAIAAGGAPFGLGSDIGGSIRMPAAFCGVFGHKPTNGLVPLTGHYPVYASGPDAALAKRSPFVVIGPIARSARDLMPLLRVMAGPDGVDPNAVPLELTDTAAVEWASMRVHVLDDPDLRFARRATGEVRAAVRGAAHVLRAAGARIERCDPALFRETIDLWAAALRSPGTPTLMQAAGLGRRRAFCSALAASALGRARHTLPLLLFGIGEELAVLRTRDLDRTLTRVHALRRAFDDMLGDDGVLLMPTHPRAAPRHNRPMLRPLDFAYTAFLNTLRVPATTAPFGFDADGLPIGVQIAARAGRDHHCLAAAELLERRIGGTPLPELP
jgi:fatty acid amide hydrolase 2